MKKFLILVVICLSVFSLVSCSFENHTVSFNTGGAGEIKDVTVKHGFTLSEPFKPYKNGYTFKGWEYNGKTWNFFFNTVKSDMTLHAIWEPNVYQISFDCDGGTEIMPVSAYCDSRLVLAPSEKEYFNFISWEFNGKNVNVLDVPPYDVELKAIWDPDRTYWTIIQKDIVECRIEDENVVVPGYYVLDGNKVEINKITSGCFGKKTNLKNVVIEEGVKQLDNSCFLGLKNLEKVVLPNTIETIGSFCFYESTLKEIVIPSSVQYIHAYAFYHVSNDIKIFIDLEEKPSGWGSMWVEDCVEVYWKGEWEYNQFGEPVATK